jgi:hypothetical protein
MSYNGSGTFNINSTGQPVVAGTVISSSAFNSLTSDLATGLSTAITKDGQTTTTARITFAQGLTSSLSTDSSSVSTGSIITDGGVGIAKNVYVGGTLNVTGSTTLTNPVINNIKMGYTTTATAAGTTTLTVSSNYRQFFTGTTTQTIVLPVTSTLVTGIAYEIENNSTGLLTVNSSGGNLVGTVPAGVCAHAVCIGTTLTTAADWDWDYISTTTITGTGANVLGTSPTITTPTISSLSSAAATALTLQSAGTTAITIDTSQNVGIGTSSPSGTLHVKADNASARVEGNNSTNSTQFIVKNTTSNFYVALDSNSGGSFGKANAAVLWMDSANPMVFATNNSERMRIDSSGNVGIGTSSYTDRLAISVSPPTAASRGVTITDGTRSLLNQITGATYSYNGVGANENLIYANGAPLSFLADGQPIKFCAGTAERMRIDSSGNVGIGITPTQKLDVKGNQRLVGDSAYILWRDTADSASSGIIQFPSASVATIGTYVNQGMLFQTNNTERMRIDSSGTVLIAKTASSFSTAGFEYDGANKQLNLTTSGNSSLRINRTTNDGVLVSFQQDAAEEGTISVSGTTVSYNGGHLSRYAQTTTAKDNSLVKGTVLSNLDAMNVYTDAEGNPVANEQLNKVKVSDVSGDANVAGVFVNWSYDESHQVDEINMAMTGDMIIRIAQGITVQRGDLLMSAGDGTAKAQGDDIVRSKTIAKVTSNHVTCTYADGSYCVPCVLMAC